MSTEPTLIPVAGPQGKKTPPGAVWSLVLGILSLFCLWILGSIPAIILGALSIKKAKANPDTVGGEGIALAGIITGAIGVFTGFITIGVVAAIAMPAFNGVQIRAIEVKATANVRQVSMALQVYSVDQPNGEFPETLEELVPEYLPDSSLLSVDFPGGENAGMQYRKPRSGSEPDEPILLLKLPGNRGTVLGYPDGSVEMSNEPLDPEILNSFK